MKLTNIHKILFITLSNIGDVILTLPVLTAIKDNFKNAEIDIVVGPRPRDVFKKDHSLGKIFIYDKHSSLVEKLRFISNLRRRKYDLAVDMRGSLVPFLVGAKHRVGLVKSNSNPTHKKIEHLERIKSLGLKCVSKKNIYIDNEDRIKINYILLENGISENDVVLGISPSCMSFTKEWGKDSFVDVIRGLLDRENIKIVLIGEAAKIDISKYIFDKAQNKNLVDLTGKTSLFELFALIERMKVLLTCDNASMHIASDLGVKVVSIFGPTDPLEYGPTGKDDVVFQSKLACVPCKKALCRYDHECMKEIKPEKVLKAVERLLK